MNLSLSGGGARSAFQAGALEYLLSQGYKFDTVRAISGGVINGYFLQTGKASELRKFWLEDMPKYGNNWKWYAAIPLNVLRRKRGLISHNFIMSLIDKHVSEVANNLQFDVVSLFNEQQYTIRPVKDQDLQNYKRSLYASMAIPVVFPPVDITGSIEGHSHLLRDCVDGGTVYPLSGMTEDEDLKIITQFEQRSPARAKSLLSVIWRTFGYQRDKAVERIFSQDNTIAPSMQLGGVWDWKQETLETSYYHGIERAKQWHLKRAENEYL